MWTDQDASQAKYFRLVKAREQLFIEVDARQSGSLRDVQGSIWPDNARLGMITSLQTQKLANWRISAGHRHRLTRVLTVSSCPWRPRGRACVPSPPEPAPSDGHTALL